MELVACERTIDVVDALSWQEYHLGDYAPGRYAFELTHAVVCAPIALQGHLKIFPFRLDTELVP